MSKMYNTMFAVMVEGGDFVREDGRVCLFSLMRAKMKQNELKSMGYEVRVIPYCE